MKIFYFILISIFLIVGCSKKNIETETIQNNYSESKIPQVQEKIFLNSGKGIVVNNGSEAEEYIIPMIENRIMGIEDEFYTVEPVSNAELIDGYKGFTVALPPTIQNKEEIQINISFNEYQFTISSILSTYEVDNKILAYKTYLPFENKYWINLDGIWKIQVVSNQQLLLETKYESKLGELFYSEISDSPLVKIQARSVTRNKEYNYRYYSDKESLVVIYYTEDDSIYYPVKIIKPTELIKDNIITLKWTEEALPGRYFINHYALDKLPNEIEMWPLFESFNVE